jgi:hypothetical protein
MRRKLSPFSPGPHQGCHPGDTLRISLLVCKRRGHAQPCPCTQLSGLQRGSRSQSPTDTPLARSTRVSSWSSGWPEPWGWGKALAGGPLQGKEVQTGWVWGAEGCGWLVSSEGEPEVTLLSFLSRGRRTKSSLSLALGLPVPFRPASQ